MKIDFKKFKKIKSDKSTTTLQHPDGHQITVAHSALSHKIREQLAALPVHKAEGGEVPSPKSSSSPAEPNKKDAKDFEKGATASGVDPGRWVQNVKEGLGFADGGDAATDGQPLNIPDSMKVDASQPASTPQQAPVVVNVNSAPAQSPAMNFSPAHLLGAPGVPSGVFPQQAPAPMAPPQPQAPAPQPEPVQQAPQMPVQQAPSDPYGTQSSAQTYMTGLGEQMSGQAAQMKAEQQGAAARQAAAVKSANAQQDMLTSFQNNNTHYQEQVDHFIDQYSQSKIDPERYMSNMGTGSKIASAIGLILGGFGAAAGQENLGMKMLQTNIDRDIDAQKAEMGKRHNLVSAAMQVTGDVRQATTLASAIQERIAAHQIDAAANAAGGLAAKARYLQASGQLKQQASDKIRSLAMNDTMMRALGNANNDPAAMGSAIQAMRLVNPELAKSMEEKWVPGVGLAQVPVPQEVRGKMIASKHLDDQLATLEQFSKDHSGSLDPQTVAKGAALAAQVQDAYRQANAQGVFKESEKNFVAQSVSSNPTAFFSKYRTLPGYQVTRKNNQDLLRSLQQGYGIQQQQIPVAPPVPIKR